MKRRYAVIVLLLIAVALCLTKLARVGLAPSISAEEAFERKLSGVFIEVEGEVIKILEDDYEPPRHQRFIVRLASGQTLLVIHNIDLARRVPVEEGSLIKARGKYEWNMKGGIIHWTHRDPRGREPGGWIQLIETGKTYSSFLRDSTEGAANYTYFATILGDCEGGRKTYRQYGRCCHHTYLQRKRQYSRSCAADTFS